METESFNYTKTIILLALFEQNYIVGVKYTQRLKILLKMIVGFDIDRACNLKLAEGNTLHYTKRT